MTESTVSDIDMFMKQPQLCLVCGHQTLRVIERGIGGGVRIKVECTSCKSKGRIGNIEPFRGIELSEKELSALFTLAGIEILRKWPIQNQYWGTSDEDMPNPHCGWLVKTPAGLIEIGWRKRVMSIDWSDTNVRAEVTKDEVTKDEHLVHAYTEEKALEYLKELRRQMTIACLPV